MTSVHPFVRLSVTLAHFDHIVQHKVEMGTSQDRSVCVLAICTVIAAGPNRNVIMIISCDPEFYGGIPKGYGKCGVFTSAARI